MKCEILFVNGQKVYLPNVDKVEIEKMNAVLLNFRNKKGELVAQFNINTICGWTLVVATKEVREAA